MARQRVGGRLSCCKGDPAESGGEAFLPGGIAENIRRTVRASGRAIARKAFSAGRSAIARSASFIGSGQDSSTGGTSAAEKGEICMTLKGSYVALITPFHQDGSVNFEKLEELIEMQIRGGTDGIVVLGTTGESSTMSHEEDEDVVRCALSAISGRCALIAGSGSNSTETALMKSKAYDKLGVDALLLITPYYNKANQTGMVRHFTMVADQVDSPVIVYNVPGRTGCALSVKSVEALSRHPGIIGIKEASGDMSFMMNIAHLASKDFAIVSGNDDITLPIMAAGGTGVISVLANVCPEVTYRMTHAFLEGDILTARELQLRYLDLIHALFMEVNPIPVKEAMNLMGLNVGPLRMPLCEMEPDHRQALSAVLHRYGLAKE